MIAILRKKFASVKEPERSLTLRYFILAAMLVPLLALARVTILWPHVLIAAIGISAGHWYSYRNLATSAGPLAQRSQLVRGIMFVGIHVALCWLFIGLAAGAAVPQAQFAIFTQAITSFDLRYRSSLFNTLFHSLANLYIAASLSRTSELAIYFLLFAVFVLAAFFVAEKEDGMKAAKLLPRPIQSRPAAPRFSPPGRSLLLFGLGFGAAALLAISVVFFLTPRFANRPIVPPFSINIPLRGGVKSQIINPGVPLVQVNGWSDGTSDYFYGFDNQLDLRYRGGLSDEVVMYVRSPSRSYWRSHSYDFYTGESWDQSDPTLTRLPFRYQVYYEISPPLGSPLSTTGRRVERPSGQLPDPSQQIVQSFNLVRDQPNLIFAAYRPAEIFIVAEQVSVDSGDGLRLPDMLKAGLTYSVVSYRPDFEPDLLRHASNHYPPEIAQRYLQLPAHISERVRQLAKTLTAPYDNNYDKIMALTNHLLIEYPYNYFPPPHPPGAEVVDTFLFRDREGVCEQYVTALVVMARTLGIPARLTAGYGPGDYNALTGYYEVRLNDAHSWAEIYFPEYGWVPFDPTPGWTPQPYPTPVQTWLFSNNGFLAGLELPVGALVAGGAAGLALVTPFLIAAMLMVGFVFLLLFLSRRLRLALARRLVQRYSRLPAHQARRAILAMYQRGANLLAHRKYQQRATWETVAEYAQRVGDLPGLAQLTQVTEIAAYRPEAPDEAMVAEAEAALAALKQEIKRPPA